MAHGAADLHQLKHNSMLAMVNGGFMAAAVGALAPPIPVCRHHTWLRLET
jgi:hypothetical protein